MMGSLKKSEKVSAKTAHILRAASTEINSRGLTGYLPSPLPPLPFPSLSIVNPHRLPSGPTVSFPKKLFPLSGWQWLDLARFSSLYARPTHFRFFSYSAFLCVCFFFCFVFFFLRFCFLLFATLASIFSEGRQGLFTFFSRVPSPPPPPPPTISPSPRLQELMVLVSPVSLFLFRYLEYRDILGVAEGSALVKRYGDIGKERKCHEVILCHGFLCCFDGVFSLVVKFSGFNVRMIFCVQRKLVGIESDNEQEGWAPFLKLGVKLPQRTLVTST